MQDFFKKYIFRINRWGISRMPRVIYYISISNIVKQARTRLIIDNFLQKV